MKAHNCEAVGEVAGEIPQYLIPPLVPALTYTVRLDVYTFHSCVTAVATMLCSIVGKSIKSHVIVHVTVSQDNLST